MLAVIGSVKGTKSGSMSVSLGCGNSSCCPCCSANTYGNKCYNAIEHSCWTSREKASSGNNGDDSVAVVTALQMFRKRRPFVISGAAALLLVLSFSTALVVKGLVALEAAQAAVPAPAKSDDGAAERDAKTYESAQIEMKKRVLCEAAADLRGRRDDFYREGQVDTFTEKLFLHPLNRNFLLAEFHFFIFTQQKRSTASSSATSGESLFERTQHYEVFPKEIGKLLSMRLSNEESHPRWQKIKPQKMEALSPLIRFFDASLTEGRWKTHAWGSAAAAGASPLRPPGALLRAALPADPHFDNERLWSILRHSLGGILCASFSQSKAPTATFLPSALRSSFSSAAGPAVLNDGPHNPAAARHTAAAAGLGAAGDQNPIAGSGGTSPTTTPAGVGGHSCPTGADGGGSGEDNPTDGGAGGVGGCGAEEALLEEEEEEAEATAAKAEEAWKIRVVSSPLEATCTENLTSFQRLLPCRGEAGLLALLHPLAFAAAPFKSLRVVASSFPLFKAEDGEKEQRKEETKRGFENAKVGESAGGEKLTKSGRSSTEKPRKESPTRCKDTSNSGSRFFKAKDREVVGDRLELHATLQMVLPLPSEGAGAFSLTDLFGFSRERSAAWTFPFLQRKRSKKRFGLSPSLLRACVSATSSQVFLHVSPQWPHGPLSSSIAETIPKVKALASTELGQRAEQTAQLVAAAATGNAAAALPQNNALCQLKDSSKMLAFNLFPFNEAEAEEAVQTGIEIPPIRTDAVIGGEIAIASTGGVLEVERQQAGSTLPGSRKLERLENSCLIILKNTHPSVSREVQLFEILPSFLSLQLSTLRATWHSVSTAELVQRAEPVVFFDSHSPNVASASTSSTSSAKSLTNTPSFSSFSRSSFQPAEKAGGDEKKRLVWTLKGAAAARSLKLRLLQPHAFSSSLSRNLSALFLSVVASSFSAPDEEEKTRKPEKINAVAAQKFPSTLQIHLLLPPAASVEVSFTLKKRFLSAGQFAFSPDKGLDVGGALLLDRAIPYIPPSWSPVLPISTNGFQNGNNSNSRCLTNNNKDEWMTCKGFEEREIMTALAEGVQAENIQHSWNWLFTESSIQHVPLPDFSMPFNVLALSGAVVTIFYGSVFRLCTVEW